MKPQVMFSPMAQVATGKGWAAVYGHFVTMHPSWNEAVREIFHFHHTMFLEAEPLTGVIQ